MILSLIASAAALTQAMPANNAGQWTAKLNYPQITGQHRKGASVYFSLLVSPAGMVEHCEIRRSSGFQDLDRKTCDALVARAKFVPAKDETGLTTYSIFEGRTSWNVGRQTEAAVFDPDLELQVQKLPGGAREASIGIAIKVDPSGRVILCEPAMPNPSSAQLAVVACTQAKIQYDGVKTNASGTPITFIRTMQVRFKAAS